ncbi:uncharacterized protein RCO7_03444 [Rhynchosporium graminicola]|uniref:SET domain-containing protein n=1 Tax=Rhynchosporium graminicola TaxID=2792576 RepID=A0A1E1LG73_9HELO|nr:uncharacterized protein RCO7_03444 [Rhynchosporium commune]
MARIEGAAEQSLRNGIPLERAAGLVLVMDTPKGRGVFASRDIPGRTVIEVSPVLVLDPVENEEHVRKTNLYNYTYNWPYNPPPARANTQGVNATKPPTTTQAVILGLGSMFNHSTMHQNVGWDRDINNLLVTYITLRDIKAGEELCISYGQRLTFKDMDEKEPETGSEDWTEALAIIDFIN